MKTLTRPARTRLTLQMFNNQKKNIAKIKEVGVLAVKMIFLDQISLLGHPLGSKSE